MGILSRILGSDKALDAAYSGVDKAFYTDEERADNRHIVSNIKIGLLKAYQPFRVAQRFLSIIVTVPYMAGWSATFIASFFVADVSAQIEILSGDVSRIVAQITGFYFFGGAAESIGRQVVAGLSVKNRAVG